MRETIFRTFQRGRNSKTAIIIVSVAAVVIAVGLVYRLFFYHAENNNFTKSDDDTKSFNEITVGEHYTFGTYEQDNDESNGAEPLEWRVLAVEDGRALLITEKLIDCKPYNETWSNVTWKTCTLRQWLNDDFLHTAFSYGEQSKIATVTNQNPDNSSYGIKGGNETQDKIFALSIDEANNYFSSDEDRIGYATSYSKTYVWANDSSWWWLRSPGDRSLSAAYVDGVGSVSLLGYDVYSNLFAVRPALWLEL